MQLRFKRGQDNDACLGRAEISENTSLAVWKIMSLSLLCLRAQLQLRPVLVHQLHDSQTTDTGNKNSESKQTGKASAEIEWADRAGTSAQIDLSQSSLYASVAAS